MERISRTYILPNTIIIGSLLHAIEKNFIDSSILTDGSANDPDVTYSEITIIAYVDSFSTIEKILAPYV